MSYQYLRTEDAGQCRIITLSRPEKRNALSLAVITELNRALDAAVADGCRTIILASSGSVYSSGHDLREIESSGHGECRELFARCTELMSAIGTLPAVVIAEVQGMATAAGCQLVATCDLAVAAENANFATPGVRIGMFCSTPMVPLVRSIGRKRAMEMLLTGDPIDAQTAFEWGLLNAVVPAERLRHSALELAARVHQGSAAAVVAGKRLLRRIEEQREMEAYRLAVDTMAADARGPHAREGIRAILEKRAPLWPRTETVDS